jgi:hypothetical protein
MPLPVFIPPPEAPDVSSIDAPTSPPHVRHPY